jgi:hypothetical protein
MNLIESTARIAAQEASDGINWTFPDGRYLLVIPLGKGICSGEETLGSQTASKW